MEVCVSGRASSSPSFRISGPSCSVRQFLKSRHIAGQPFYESRHLLRREGHQDHEGDDEDQDEEDQDQQA